MYCSTCGNPLDAALNYCNRCGARLDKLATAGDHTALHNLSMATGFVGLGGLGLTLGLITILLKNGAVPEVIVILTMLFLAVVFGISFLMIRQISRMTGAPDVKKPLENNPPAELKAARTAQLGENLNSYASVTDTTTRSLEEVLAERK